MIDPAGAVDPIGDFRRRHRVGRTVTIEVVMKHDGSGAMFGLAGENRITKPRHAFATVGNDAGSTAGDRLEHASRRTEVGGVGELESASHSERNECREKRAPHGGAHAQILSGASVTAARTSSNPIHT
jgi:hypothetical protein